MSKTRTVYCYSPDTKEFVGEAQADENEKRPGEHYLPAFATEKLPPGLAENETVIFEGNVWTVVPDYRGTVYWLADGSEHTITELGIEPAADALNEMPEPPLVALHSEACARIDRTAEATRLLFLTPGTGQAMTYQAKEAEALALLQDQNPDPDTYPMLSAMIGIDGDTLEDVGETIRLRAAEWSAIGAEIERNRHTAKQAVKAAGTHTEIETILDGLTWPEPI